MRCLYCGKELALLKRWTRGGQFCSEAHKKSYQEEYNRIGLSRLLQAQTKSVPAALAKDAGPVPRHEAPVAVEETPLEQVPVAEEPVLETLDTEQNEADEQEQQQEEPAWEATQIAGYIKGETAEPASWDMSSYSEPWERTSASPARPEWRSSGEVQQALPHAAPVELKLRPTISDTEHSAGEVNVTPNGFGRGNALPASGGAALANRLSSAGLVPQTIVPVSSEPNAAPGVEAALSFPIETGYRESALLKLSLSQIRFSEAGADVVLADVDEARIEDFNEPSTVATEDAAAQPQEELDGAESAPADEAVLWPDRQEHHEPETPAQTVPNLATLHLAVHEAAEQMSVPEAAAFSETEPAAMAPQNPHLPPQAQHSDEAAPRVSPLLVEIPLRRLAPLKPAPKEGADALIEMPVFLPRLTGLPLRPKMGLAATTPTSKKAGRSSAQAVQPSPEASTVSNSKAAAEPKPENQPGGKPAPRTSWRTPAESGAKKASVPPARPAEKAAETPKTEPAAPVKTRPAAKRPDKPSIVSDPDRKPDPKPEPKPKPAAAQEVKPIEAARSEPAPLEIEAPSFGAANADNKSLLSSFGVKLAIAAVLVGLCIVAYFAFGGKPQAQAPAPAADNPGPSIMIASGGWVEGWAGDPADTHYGRKITIYRPSLKLSDYRIDFKGDIETKSLGWVFRAADPEDYYAMKLAIVKPGLEPKVALLKYIVVHGRESQVGRVPIDIEVKLDTIYAVRVDVKGAKFSTYVQGQLVDTWTDDQLKSGGVGFLNEREERGRIKSVSVSLLNGGK